MKKGRICIASGLIFLSSLLPVSTLLASTASSVPYIDSPGDQVLSIGTPVASFAAADVYSPSGDKISKVTVVYAGKTLVEGQYTNNGIKYNYSKNSSGKLVGRIIFSYNGNYQAASKYPVTTQVENAVGKSEPSTFYITLK